MLDDLVQTIETLRERISTYADELSKNEIRTRAVLIDPMLEALEWDVTDPGLVTVEFEAGGGRADYALRRGLNNSPVLLIEAKRYKEPLDAHVGQLLQYALARGVRYGCLTDGNTWEVYDVFKQVPMEDKKELDVTISDNRPAGEAALEMLALWQRSLGAANSSTQGGHLVQAAKPILPVEPVKPIVPPPPSGGWVSLIGSFMATSSPPPVAIRLPSGKEVPAKNWRSVIVETALWLHETGLLTQENCSIEIGKTRYLLSTDGRHQNGKQFKSPVPLADTGITLEGNFSAYDLVNHTRRLLRLVGQDPSQVYLKLP